MKNRFRPFAPSASRIRWLSAQAVAVAGLTAALGVTTAQAKLVDLHGAVLVGGMTGRGSDSSAADLFHQTEGAGLGLDLGVRLLVLDASIRFLQMVNSNGYQGTQLSALFGPSLEIPIVSGSSGSPKVVLRPGVAVGAVFGTLVPVDPPLTNDQLAAKGVLVVGRLAVERMFGPIFGIGVDFEGGYHYLFAATAPVNGTNHSSGWQIAGFATAAVHFGL